MAGTAAAVFVNACNGAWSAPDFFVVSKQSQLELQAKVLGTRKRIRGYAG